MNKKLGLTSEEVLASAAEYGTNALSQGERESFGKKFIKNLGDPMVKVLIAALIINVVFVIIGNAEWFEAAGIAAAIIISTYVSTFSEYKNESAFQMLKSDAEKVLCKVYRDGELKEIFIDDIVKGDLILIQSGDMIPADGIIIEGSVKVNQAVLNGEAEEILKEALPESDDEEELPEEFSEEELSEGLDEEIIEISQDAEKLEVSGETEKEEKEEPKEDEGLFTINKVFRGTVVGSGNALFMVTEVGDNTVYGGIHKELQEEDDRESPLKLRLKDLAGKISSIGYTGGIIIAAIIVFQKLFVNNNFYMPAVYEYMTNTYVFIGDIINAAMLAVVIIVMSVPEGLPLMIAIVSSLNMRRMLKDNVLVRKLNGIETAGSLKLLFCDKTGTITKGELECIVVADGGDMIYQSMSEMSDGYRDIILNSILLNTSSVLVKEKDSKNEYKVLGGNPTDKAMVNFARDYFNKTDAELISYIPFNSDAKMSAATITDKEGETYTLIKGAPEKIVDRCGYYYAENGKRVILDDEGKEIIRRKIKRLAEKQIRILAFAVSDETIENEKIPMYGNWAFVAIAGIRDDIRPDSISAMREVQMAGIQVVMITGDRADTAKAIAEDIGLVTSDDHMILTSSELAAMSDGEIKDILPSLRVVARALPSDKSRLVSIAQSLDYVVGMTGDGVNDSAALKKADVGFAMGSGTEVAKEAADIVILDDTFMSISKAVLFGRTIFNNIRKFIVFQLTINFSALLISLVMPVLGKEIPLTVLQILWINLVMDTLAAIAFGQEAPLKRYLREKPKSRRQKIVSKKMWGGIILGAIWTLFVGLTLILNPYVSSLFRPESLLTGYFTFFVFAAIFNAFNARTENKKIFGNLGSNRAFSRVLFLIAVIQAVLVYAGGTIFRCYGLNLIEWGIVLAAAFTIIPVDLIRKAICGESPEEIDEVDLEDLYMIEGSGIEFIRIESRKRKINFDDKVALRSYIDEEEDLPFESIKELGDKTIEEVIREYGDEEDLKKIEGIEDEVIVAEEIETAETCAEEISGESEEIEENFENAEDSEAEAAPAKEEETLEESEIGCEEDKNEE